MKKAIILISCCLLLAGVGAIFNFFDGDIFFNPSPKITVIKKNTNQPTSAIPVQTITIVEDDNQEDPIIGIIDDASSTDKKTGAWRGLCEKNSIKTIDDFKRVLQNDPVLARHYVTFNPDNASIKELKEQTIASVSHKNGDVIKRTSKPIILPKGDRYITDGITKTRLYCCNDFDFNELPPSSAGPPVKDVPPVVVTPPIYEPPPTVNENYYNPYYYGGGGGGSSKRCCDDKPEPPPSPVPEPSTLLLFGSGLIGIVGMLRARKWKTKK